jgi:hypothetical protein
MSNPSKPSVTLARSGAALCLIALLSTTAGAFAAPPPAKAANSASQDAAAGGKASSTKATSSDPSARADQLAADATRAVERGDLDTGRKLFLESLALKPSFDTMGNLGAVELAQKRYRDCAEHLTQSLRHYPPTGSESSKKRTQDKLAECRRKVGAVRVALRPDGASATLDGNLVGSAPFVDPFFVEPGAHTLALTKAGHRSENLSLNAVAGGEQTVTFELKPTSADAKAASASTGAPPSSAAPQQPSSPDIVPSRADDETAVTTSPAPLWPVFVGAGATVALLGGGVGLGLASTSSEKDGDTLKDQLAAAGKVCPGDCGELIATYESASSQRNAATRLLVSAGVVAAGTAAYYLILKPTPSSTRTAWLPLLERDRVGVMVSGSF